MSVPAQWSDRNSRPNPEADTHPDHRTALIQTQHSACASPEGIRKQAGRCRRGKGGFEKE